MKGSGGEGKEDKDGYPLVAVAIDKDKTSQVALKWALDNLIVRGQVITLVHVNTKGHQDEASTNQAREMLLPFRCFCTRKDVSCNDVILEDTDVAKAIIEFVSQAAVEKLIIGAPSRGGFVRLSSSSSCPLSDHYFTTSLCQLLISAPFSLRRMKSSDISTNISKGAPDFCTVYVISKGKISSVRNATRAAPTFSQLRAQIQTQTSIKPSPVDQARIHPVDHARLLAPRADPTPVLHSLQQEGERETIKSPFNRGGGRGQNNAKLSGDFSLTDSDISFVSSGRPSVDRPSVDRFFPQRLSNVSDSFERSSFEMRASARSADLFSPSSDSSGYSQESSRSQTMEDVEAEMRRLRLELKQTMDMYSTACKEALSAQQKAMELHRWKVQDDQKLEEARLAEEAAMVMVANEKAKCKAALDAAEASKRIAELEAQKRINAEKKALKEAEEKKAALDALAHNDVRYRKYSIEEIELATDYFVDSRKIGEGGYGPVYKCYLDHTPVAIKVLRPDAAQGRSQFQQEIEILSCIRHPNMVLLLGACPEYGCLVYEYMANGSLEDRLFCRGNTPPIPWQHRFRIAAEIGTGLLFLHQTKPEPLVHRDLKPANILLDRNYVSKISDVGLARLVPPSVANSVTQYRMTATAGTFCYIDPEYQQTGMLGIKSDIYSLGIMLLQIITGKQPMGLTHYVERAIEKGSFEEMLDPTITDWPVDDALRLAQMSIKCAELRRKDRPDLGTVILPELNRLRALAEEHMQYCNIGTNTYSSSMHSQVSMEDILSGPLPGQSGYQSSSRSSTSSITGRGTSQA